MIEFPELPGDVFHLVPKWSTHFLQLCGMKRGRTRWKYASLSGGWQEAEPSPRQTGFSPSDVGSSAAVIAKYLLGGGRGGMVYHGVGEIAQVWLMIVLWTHHRRRAMNQMKFFFHGARVRLRYVNALHTYMHGYIIYWHFDVCTNYK